MVYDFAHYNSPGGRLVRFVIDGAEYARACEAERIVAGLVLGEHPTGVGGDVEIITTPAGARALCDALAGVGGDAAIAERMLRGHLEGMVVELRAGRARLAPVREPRARAGAA